MSNTQWKVRIQILEGSLVHSENDYDFEDENDAREALSLTCDVLEESDGVAEINGEKVVRP